MRRKSAPRTAKDQGEGEAQGEARLAETASAYERSKLAAFEVTVAQ
jgi:hypothetical protein